MLFPLRLAALTAAALILNGTSPAAVPRYDHIFVIVDENKDLNRVIGRSPAPHINEAALTYGYASHYDAVAHPSEPNYVALVGGGTFGIHDDGPFTKNAVDAPSLATQLDAAHLSWKGYYEDIPAPGSLVTYHGLYASKHSGFLNFLEVQRDPARLAHLVGFDELDRDAASDRLPNFALIVPNLCNDMHGAMGNGAPPDCWPMRASALIARGDTAFANIVERLTATPMWKSAQNVAIVLTYDEDDAGGTEGGGGRVPLVVMTNHGPRHFVDATPYTHYSLLRTIEESLGLAPLASAQHATLMTPLFSLGH